MIKLKVYFENRLYYLFNIFFKWIQSFLAENGTRT